jgi:hypothetical protein
VTDGLPSPAAAAPAGHRGSAAGVVVLAVEAADHQVGAQVELLVHVDARGGDGGGAVCTGGLVSGTFSRRHIGVPVAVGRPVTVTVQGQRIEMRTWRLGSAEAVVAVSGQPFPMPAGAHAASGGGMAWSARLGKISLYCLNGPTSELLAAPVPAAELAALAARLRPA